MAASWQQRLDRLEQQIAALVADSTQLREQSQRHCREARRLKALSHGLVVDSDATAQRWGEQIETERTTTLVR
jgi:hypothetical protein